MKINFSSWGEASRWIRNRRTNCPKKDKLTNFNLDKLKLVKEHMKELTELRTDYCTEIRRMRSNYNAQRELLIKDHEDDLKALKEEHDI